MGAMRLSTESDRDDNRSIAVLHAAFDAGVTLVDTADAYCLDAADEGHNELVIARALATWSGDRSRIVAATKGGLTRPAGQWVPDGRARHLREACEQSLRRLGVDRLALYQLHAPDPRVPLATAVRALASLRAAGLVGAIGLSNVTVGQIEEAQRITEVAAVQVELSLWHDDNILSGVVAHCLRHSIRVLAHRPLGGATRRRRVAADPVLAAIGSRHGATPFEVALAALMDLSPAIAPLPGPTRVESAASLARVQSIVLTDEDRRTLEEHFPTVRGLRSARAAGTRGAASAARGEVVLVMGLPGAGKSTVARSLAADGYARLNRDEAGGSLKALVPALDALIDRGATRIVLDNTYVSRKQRAPVIQAAAKRGFATRCVWLTTSVEEAQVNAVTRIVSRYGRLLTPEEMHAAVKTDVSAFGPAVQFRYQRDLEPPDPSEGFAAIEARTFARVPDFTHAGRALLIWCDEVLMRSRSGRRTPVSADDLEIVPGTPGVLQRYEREGWRILGLSWQPDVAAGTMTADEVEACFDRMRELLGVAIEIRYCPHAAGPPVCWCRKPLPGLGVGFIQRHRLDPPQCLYVGAGPQDPGFARRLGFRYRTASELFR
jgi:aryl-alcohol dehydrogenase-like predicted oxidoreductase/histidinol phosphatase-like enzyme